MTIEDAVYAVVGAWNSAAVLEASGLDLTPKGFVAELKRRGIRPCRKCSRYRRDDVCVCEVKVG